MLGLTFLCQFVYGYMGALSICLLAVLPGAGIPRLPRLRRVLWIGAVALLLSAFQLVPLWLDRGFINGTPKDQAWKSDSFGAPRVLEWLVSGQLLDNGRFPILSLLVAGRSDRSLAPLLQAAGNRIRRQIRDLRRRSLDPALLRPAILGACAVAVRCHPGPSPAPCSGRCPDLSGGARRHRAGCHLE